MVKEKKESLCPVAKKCGGCQLLRMNYKKQLAWKKEQTAQLLKPYGRLEGIIGMEKPEHYRCKVHAVFGRDGKGNIISGTYQAKTHKIVPVEKCLLENEKADMIIATIRKLVKSFKIKIYDEDTGYGLLRHVMIRVGYETGQIMVVLVLRSPILPSKNNFIKALIKEHPEITTVVINVNDQKTSMVLGKSQQVVYGPGYIKDRLCGMEFKISPRAFYQVNPPQAQRLYEKVIEYADLSGTETVLDAYCGTGTIGMIAAPHAGHVIGVELNRDAVRDAVAGAKENRISNIRFYQADAGELAVEIAEEGDQVDVVLMDPPRTGSSEKFLKALTVLKPKKIVYVSCNPETLVRDLKYLCGNGYQMKKGVAVDMFPFTDDVETCVLLSRKKSGGKSTKIEIEIDLSEADRRECIGTATYQEIKNYVWEHYQTKVSHLYIAQIKKKCGLDVGENFNKPKTEGNRVPNCPIEKERMIIEALEYFGMINKE